MGLFPFGPCSKRCAGCVCVMPLKLNFITPINKIFPSPLLSASKDGGSSVFLVLNSEGDLSLYRNSEQVWTAGRFKKIIDLQWSPDGKTHVWFILAYIL